MITSLRVLGALDPSFGWDGQRLVDDRALAAPSPPPPELRGAASVADWRDATCWRLLRDPIGLNKLFWATDADGTLTVAARPRRLVEGGHRFEHIAALPAGAVIERLREDSAPREWSLVPDGWRKPAEAPTIEATGKRIRAILDSYLAAVAEGHRDTPVFVCLSGGLDSSAIAALAREHFPSLTAVSFDLLRPKGAPSDDRSTAERLARDLGLPLLRVSATADELLEHLDTVLAEGADWRDFNVHAGLVNAVLAAGIRRELDSGGTALVLTGDLPNEFLVDYHAERYRDETYYPLPQVRPIVLRRALVRGLDTSHREIGVFAAWSLTVVQPYAVAVDEYMSLPEAALLPTDRKERLNRAMLGRTLPDYIYSRPKARAQVGGAEGGGVLGACVDRGIDAGWLERRFAELHSVADLSGFATFMRGGRYRAASPLETPA